MRKVIVAAFVSLDSVMQAPGGPHEDPTGGFAYGGWVAPLADEEFGAEVGKLFAEPCDLLLGRKTYEIFAAHWPYMEDGPDAAIAKLFNRITKYVAMRSDTPLTWQGSVALRDAARDVAQLKRENGPALVTQGSSDLLQTLFAHDLVDEIRTFTFPLLLGKGKKLFGAGTIPAAFAFVEGGITSSGLVAATYRRAGDVQTGDYEMDPPTALELARRDRMQREG